MPMFAEYAYYAIILNAIFGYVSVPLVGAGMMAGLAAFCVSRLGPAAGRVWATIWIPLACAAAFLMIQTIHGESLLDPYNRPFLTWALTLIVAQCLALRRRFLHRYAVASMVIGLLMLPYLNLEYEVTSDYQRAGLDASIGYSNGNALAGWFGFCCVYAIVLAIETKRTLVRLISLAFAAGFLFIVGLTVSRGTLVGIALAAAIAVCQSLKRKLLPVLLLTVVGAIVVSSGIFDQVIGSYVARSGEETGRLLTWPVVIQEFLGSPLTGTGVSHAEVFVAEKGEMVTPHNGFLFIALTAGIVPLVLFTAYWWKAGKRAFDALKAGAIDAPYFLPLVLYAFVIMLFTNQAFMSDWAVVTVATTLGAGTTLQSVRWHSTAPLVHANNSTARGI